MKTKLLLFVIISIIYTNIFSQNYSLPINDFLIYKFEKIHLNDTNFHSAIKPYKCDSLYFNSLNYCVFKQNINLMSNKYFVFKPIINTVLAYDVANKELLNNFAVGTNLSGNLQNTITYNLDIYAQAQKFANYNNFMLDSMQMIPHFGKNTNNIKNIPFWLNATGYINYAPAKYIDFEIGRGKNFWGDGVNSLLLSDNSNAYPYLKSTVDVWRVKYVYMISKFKDYNSKLGFDDLQNKYAVSHFLSYNATKWLNFNFFETIIASPTDSLGAKQGINVNYLNPVVFLRPVEFASGTSDNVMMGFGGLLKITKYNWFYGQFILDEFILSKVKERNGWWGNKQGVQIGMKAFKLFYINNLYLQLEANYVRPFVYSHENSIRCWGNYYQPMAHQLGANFKDVTGILRYNYNEIYLSAKLSYSEFGTDNDTTNYGQNIYIPYLQRTKEDGNFVGQGNLNKLVYCQLAADYPIVEKWNLYLETSLIIRKQSSLTINNQNLIFNFGIKTLLVND